MCDGSFAYEGDLWVRAVTVHGFFRKEMQALCMPEKSWDFVNWRFNEETGCAVGELQRILHFIAVHYALFYCKCFPLKPFKQKKQLLFLFLFKNFTKR